jgi:hypothetical protein
MASPHRIRAVADGAEIEAARAILISGAAARLVDHPDGRSAAIELFAAPTLLELDVRGGRIVALGESTYVAEQRFTIEQRACSGSLATEQALMQKAWVEVLLFEPVRARIAYLLLVLSSAHQRSAVIPVRLPYSRIANLCGVTERSVDRSMAAWVADGVLARTREGYAVIDRAALHRILGEWGERIDFDASQTRRLHLCFA